MAPATTEAVRRAAQATRLQRLVAIPPQLRPPMSFMARVFYGWYIVAAVFAITTVTSGLVFYNLAILLAAFVAERGFPVGLVSTATATFFIAGGLGGLVAGRLAERIDVRLVICMGAAVAALCLASVGLLGEVWQLFAFHVLFGFAYGTAGLVPVTTLIARWFNVRRSLAFSIGSTGLSFGGIVVAPVVALAVDAPSCPTSSRSASTQTTWWPWNPPTRWPPSSLPGR